MLELPKTIRGAIREAIQPQLTESSFSAVMSNISSGVLELFEAQQLFLVFESDNGSAPLVLFKDAQEASDEEFAQRLSLMWVEKGVHERVTKDLVQRLSAISYSAFSWPYARFSVERDVLSGSEVVMPRDYSILLPISSNLIVHDREESAFFGYLGIFFSNFPQISDEIVQLIIVLPTLLSEISAAYLRRE